MSTSSQNEPAHKQATIPLSEQQLTEIRADLAAVPAPPWRWIGVRGCGGPQLVTGHSGRQYLLRAAKPADIKGDEVLDPHTDCAVYGDLEFREQRSGETYSTMRTGDQLAIGRTEYDPDAITGVDNPVARWVERSAAHASALLAEMDRLTAELKAAQDKLHAIGMTRTWRLENGKKVVYVEDVAGVLFDQSVTASPLPAPADGPAVRLAKVLRKKRNDVVTATPVDATTLDMTVEPATWADWTWWVKRLGVEVGQTTFRGSYATAKGSFGRVQVLLTGRGVPDLYAAERDDTSGRAR